MCVFFLHSLPSIEVVAVTGPPVKLLPFASVVRVCPVDSLVCVEPLCLSSGMALVGIPPPPPVPGLAIIGPVLPTRKRGVPMRARFENRPAPTREKTPPILLTKFDWPNCIEILTEQTAEYRTGRASDAGNYLCGCRGRAFRARDGLCRTCLPFGGYQGSGLRLARLPAFIECATAD